MSYRKFFAMLTVSGIVMFVLMYLNIFSVHDFFVGQMKIWMTLMMVAAMAIVMMLFMGKMYKNKRLNRGIIIGSAVAFVLCLFLVRSQRTVGDESWLRAMIPHHSIAILTSTRAQLEDEEVKALAEKIAQDQRSEIDQMTELLEKLKKD